MAESGDEILMSVTIQVKAVHQFFHVVPLGLSNLELLDFQLSQFQESPFHSRSRDNFNCLFV